MKLLQKLLMVLFLGTMLAGHSQNIVIAGLVQNYGTHVPVADHLVYIATLNGSDTIATTTDEEGYFIFKTVEMNDSAAFLGSIITHDPCTGEMLYETLTFNDSLNFVEFFVCKDSMIYDCQAMFEFYSLNITDSMTQGIDSATTNAYAVQFLDYSIGAKKWHWDFGDGMTSFEQNPIHYYEMAGAYDVLLTIKSGNCESTHVMSVWVEDPISECYTWFSYSYGADSLYLPEDSISNSPLQVSFYDYSMQNNTYWKWKFGDGTTSTEQNPIHTYAKPGVYFVSLEAGNNDCSSISEQSIFIETYTNNCQAAMEYEVGAYISATDSMYTSGYEVSFTDVSVGNPDYWRWDFGDGKISTEQNPVHYYAEPGMYSVVLFMGNDSCFSTLYDWITVIGNGGPDSSCYADFIIEYQDCGMVDSIGGDCNNAFPVQFHNVSSGTITEWFWDFGDGTYSKESDPLHVFTAGIFDVVLYAKGPNCESAITHSIWLNYEDEDSTWNPESCMAMFYPIIAENNRVEFVNESFGEIEKYFWDFGDGNTSTEENPVHEYSSEGYYFVSLEISSADSCMSYFYMDIWLDDYISEESLVAFFVPEIKGKKVVFHNQSEGHIENWHWDFGDGNTTDTQEAEHEYAEKGKYIVTLGASNFEAVTTFTLEIDLESETFKAMVNSGATSISDTDNSFEQFSVYPNPVNTEANININSGVKTNAIISVLNTAGQTILQKRAYLNIGQNAVKLNTNKLKQGVYILNISADGFTQSLKITK